MKTSQHPAAARLTAQAADLALRGKTLRLSAAATLTPQPRTASLARSRGMLPIQQHDFDLLAGFDDLDIFRNDRECVGRAHARENVAALWSGEVSIPAAVFAFRNNAAAIKSSGIGVEHPLSDRRTQGGPLPIASP